MVSFSLLQMRDRCGVGEDSCEGKKTRHDDGSFVSLHWKRIRAIAG